MSKPELYVSLVAGPNCESESYALRSMLEYFGARVTLHWIGRPKDFIDVLSGEDRDNKIDYLFLNFHGDEGRFCIPELDESVYEADEPRGEYLDLQAIRKHADLKDIHVITTGCTLGEEQLAKVFLESGCKTYIGPNDYIDGNAALMFVVRYMYELIQDDIDQEEAFERAKSIDQETMIYQFYK